MNLFSATTKQSQNGFTLLFAALVTSLLLSVGLAIFNITLQQFLLSSAGRESQYAFYSADSGAECAFYYDRKGGSFTNQPAFYFPDGVDGHEAGPTITCNGIQSETPIVITAESPIFKTQYNINSDSSGNCDLTKPSFSIVVTKTINELSTNTTIESRGYNTCDSDNLRRVERGLRVDY